MLIFKNKKSSFDVICVFILNEFYNDIHVKKIYFRDRKVKILSWLIELELDVLPHFSILK